MAPQSSQPLADRQRRALRIVVTVAALVGIAVVGATFLFFLARDIANAEQIDWMGRRKNTT